MKKYLIALMIALSSATMVVADAEAKRMGGGSSIGRQSQGVSRQTPPAAPNQATQASPSSPAAAPAGVTPRPASPWRNILGGALLGLGLGALLSHFGIGGAFASAIATILMIALLAFAVMFIIRMIRNRNGGGQRQPAYSAAHSPGGSSGPMMRTPEIGSRIEPQARPAAFQAEPMAGAATAAAAATSSLPAGFDVDGFLRHAKTYFIRLQAAWDRADIDDIREFTTPEMFAELRLQLQERGASPNHTDVVSLNAELLKVDQVGDDYLATVRFSGMIREAQNAPAESFVEAWNLSKPVAGQGGWVLAGIQQLSDVA
ncbi:TIM44-like domain-containing protein [Noviherbaspirillum sp. CPCC 100848]|uniref:TIM44-like domain-containing protein n=1 Tax=Noviherbaspirillum album TaxID=3080276 RepID=A0ABU6J761_9BURK|nr:TIM44-like domain-containing protein [Noviherbaspirillum sp. CPCC 100848]MEC4719127.1 TIM44-like domain-containing protein [Noviherbaspirillum sp. CPCC 100848]